MLDRSDRVAVDNLNAVLDEQNRKAIADSLQNVRTITENFVAPSKEVSELVDNANATVLAMTSLLEHVDQSYIAKGGLKDQASQTLNDFDRLAKNLVDTNRQLQQVLQENRPGLHEFTQSTLTQVSNLVSDMQRFHRRAVAIRCLGRARSGAAAVRRAAGGIPAAMTRPTARLSRRFVPSVLVLALAGCSGLFGGGAPAHLYRVTPKSTYPPNLPHRSVQLLVDVPLSPAGLDTTRHRLDPVRCLDRLFCRFGMDRSRPPPGTDGASPILREQQGDHRDRPRIGRAACGFHPQARDSAFRGGLRFVQTGRPKSGWRSTSGSSIPPTARSSRKPRSSSASALRQTTFQASSLAFDEALGGGDEGHRRLDGHQSRFVGEARLAILDAFCSREDGRSGELGPRRGLARQPSRNRADDSRCGDHPRMSARPCRPQQQPPRRGDAGCDDLAIGGIIPTARCFDPTSHAQYFFHAHPAEGRPPTERGHFHTFLRAEGMPRGVVPLLLPELAVADVAAPPPQAAPLKRGERDEVSHLIAIAIDVRGEPIRLVYDQSMGHRRNVVPGRGRDPHAGSIRDRRGGAVRGRSTAGSAR